MADLKSGWSTAWPRRQSRCQATSRGTQALMTSFLTCSAIATATEGAMATTLDFFLETSIQRTRSRKKTTNSITATRFRISRSGRARHASVRSSTYNLRTSSGPHFCWRICIRSSRSKRSSSAANPAPAVMPRVAKHSCGSKCRQRLWHGVGGKRPGRASARGSG